MVNCILEQCDIEFMTMVLFDENAFWVWAIENVSRRWEQTLPPHHFIRLVKAILTARYNYITTHGFLLSDGEIACSADILLFNSLLHQNVHQTVFGIPKGAVLDWDIDTIKDRIECSRLHKSQSWTRMYGSKLLYDLSDPEVFNAQTDLIRNRGPPTKTLQSLQEEYEAWRGRVG